MRMAGAFDRFRLSMSLIESQSDADVGAVSGGAGAEVGGCGVAPRLMSRLKRLARARRVRRGLPGAKRKTKRPAGGEDAQRRELVRFEELVVRTQLPRKWLRRKIADGQLPAIKAGNILLFNVQSVRSEER